MKTRYIILIFFVMATFTACHHKDRWLKEAETHFEEGCEQLSAKQSEAAAESFSHALLAINRCDLNQLEVKQLKGQIEDNLGTRYWKHGLFEEALTLHTDAASLFQEINDSTLLMNALRNCGRAKASLGDIEAAQQHYDEALNIAKALNDKTMESDILLESSRDVLLVKEDYNQVIERVSQALEGGAETDICHLTLGVAYYYLEQDSLALLHLGEATKSKKAGTRMSAYQSMSFIHQIAGNYQQALECHELFNENMMQADEENRSEQVQRIKAEYDLQAQKNELQTAQRLKNVRLYLFISLLLIALLTAFFILRQKMLNDKLKLEQMKNQMELALKKNKVYVTALALSEQVTSSSLAFNLDERDWQDFIELTDFAYGDFTKRLMAQYPTLTDSDLQICCLTKQGFTNQVISILLGIQTASFARRKSYIKQEKMNGLNDERSFEEIINAV